MINDGKRIPDILAASIKAERLNARRDARRKRKVARQRFGYAKKAERGYAKNLRKVAKQVGDIIRGMAPEGVVRNVTELTAMLNRYAELIAPWAASVSSAMFAEVNQRDKQAWAAAGRELGVGLRTEVRGAALGDDFRQLMAEQVDLITSLPRKAAERVHKLAIEGMSGGTRAKQSAKEILRSGKVTESRAMLIARTETARTASAMTQNRATYVGSEGYIWRSAEDSDVRPIHKKLNGKYFKWDDPPVAGENGERAHPGAIYNCRCYPEPVLPETIQ